MSSHLALKLLFGGILAGMLVVTTIASLKQPLWEWAGLVAEPDRWWTYATLADAYFGFLTFYAWVFYKEATATARATVRIPNTDKRAECMQFSRNTRRKRMGFAGSGQGAAARIFGPACSSV
mgnify:CR=1 FL=1